MNQKSVDGMIGLLGCLVGVLALLLPSMSKFLAIVLSVNGAFIYFLPHPDEGSGASTNDEFASRMSFVQIGFRYLVVSWMILVVLQQYARHNFVSMAPIVVTEALEYVSGKQILEGPRSSVVLEVARIQDIAAGKILFAYSGDEKMRFFDFNTVIKRAVEVAAEPVEQTLFTLGMLFIMFGGLLMILMAMAKFTGQLMFRV